MSEPPLLHCEHTLYSAIQRHKSHRKWTKNKRLMLQSGFIFLLVLRTSHFLFIIYYWFGVQLSREDIFRLSTLCDYQDFCFLQLRTPWGWHKKIFQRLYLNTERNLSWYAAMGLGTLMTCFSRQSRRDVTSAAQNAEQVRGCPVFVMKTSQPWSELQQCCSLTHKFKVWLWETGLFVLAQWELMQRPNQCGHDHVTYSLFCLAILCGPYSGE